MPMAIGLLALEVVGLGGLTLFGLGAATTASIVGSTILLGATVGASLLLSPTTGSPLSTTEPIAGNPIRKTDVTLRQALPARFVDIGRVRTGGVLFFLETKDAAPSTRLFTGVILSCAEINLVEDVYLNDTSFTALLPLGDFHDQGTAAATYDPGGAGIVNPNIWVETGNGTPGDTWPQLIGADFPSRNNINYAARGLAYAVMIELQGATPEEHSSWYPNGGWKLTAVIRGAKLPDPRLSVDLGADMEYPNGAAWVYSANAALAVLRFLLDKDLGWGHDPDDFDLLSFANAADACAVVDAADPSSRILYAANGRYVTTDARKATLDRLLENCDGRLIEQPSGKAALFVGFFPSTVVEITTANILEAQFEAFGDTLDRVGSVRPRIVLESENWQETDITSVDVADPDEDQALKQVDLPLPFCTSEYQARRLASARLKRLNPAWRGTIVTNLTGLRAMGERFVRIKFDPLGINKVFEIGSGAALNVQNFTVTFDDLVSIEPNHWNTPT